MILKDNGEVETEEESDTSLEDESEGKEIRPHDGDLLVVRRVLNVQAKEEDDA